MYRIINKVGIVFMVTVCLLLPVLKEFEDQVGVNTMVAIVYVIGACLFILEDPNSE